jgi:hypothetical protein
VHPQQTAFNTAIAGLAQYLIFRKRRVTITISDGRVWFAFDPTPGLAQDITNYNGGAEVCAIEYDRAGRILRGLILQARKQAEYQAARQ